MEATRADGLVQDTDDEPDTPPPAVEVAGDDPPPSSKPESTPVPPIGPEEVEQADLAMVEESELGKAIAERLRTVYQPMEVWYLRSSVEKVSSSSRPIIIKKLTQSSL
jgi:hypothetical protein